MALPLLDPAKMRELDRITIEEIGIPGPVLMEVAGRACAEAVEELLTGEVGAVAIVCGKGNNGGDGMVAARHLHHAGHRVAVFLLADPAKLSGDALLNKEILDRIGLHVEALPDPEAVRGLDLGGYDVVLDAIFGTGLTSEVRGVLAAGIERINASGAPVVAVDIPSGISAETGAVMGAAVRADRTVTFAFAKPGHVVYPGAGHTGDLSVVDIGIPPDLAPVDRDATWLLTDDDLVTYLSRRDPAAHKGHFGHLVVVAGSKDKPGAAGLCCRAASRAGAGLVTLAGSPEVVRRVVVGSVEYMGAGIDSLDELVAFCEGKSAVALGPGLGTGPEAVACVRRLAGELPLPVVIDADGLNNLVGELKLLDRAPAPRILTPHPGEMARLMGISTAQVQADRLAVVRRLSREHGCMTVLKGAGTVVAQPNGTAYVVPVGNPGMASGGTGDVLTGIIGALLAGGLEASEAACVGAFLHGLAGDVAAIERSQRALIADDIVEALAPVLRTFEGWQDEDEPDLDDLLA